MTDRLYQILTAHSRLSAKLRREKETLQQIKETAESSSAIRYDSEKVQTSPTDPIIRYMIMIEEQYINFEFILRYIRSLVTEDVQELYDFAMDKDIPVAKPETTKFLYLLAMMKQPKTDHLYTIIQDVTHSLYPLLPLQLLL